MHRLSGGGLARGCPSAVRQGRLRFDDERAADSLGQDVSASQRHLLGLAAVELTWCAFFRQRQPTTAVQHSLTTGEAVSSNPKVRAPIRPRL